MAFIIPAGTGLTMATPGTYTFLRKSGTTIVANTMSKETIVRLASDVTTSSTSYVDITGLSFSAAASTNYVINACLLVQTSDATVGLGISINGPASPTNLVFMSRIGTGVGGASLRNGRAYDTGTANAGLDVANVNYAAAFTAILRNGSNTGTVILRLKAEAGTATVRVMTHSAMGYRVVA